jgi:hypothetical protein
MMQPLAASMDADWEFEVGHDSPVIAGRWEGMIDLRGEPQRVREIAETQMLPGLAEGLVRLNAEKSPVWTSKTDVFVPEEVDPDELSASSEDAASAIGCYVDVLMREGWTWDSAAAAERACRKICDRLKGIPLDRCRVDMVIREAHGAGSNQLGATAYLTACGRTPKAAGDRLAECLMSLVDELVKAQ